MKEKIEKWLTVKGETDFLALSQNADFIKFLSGLFPHLSAEILISKTAGCAIAIGQDDIDSYSGCLSIALSNE